MKTQIFFVLLVVFTIFVQYGDCKKEVSNKVEKKSTETRDYHHGRSSNILRHKKVILPFFESMFYAKLYYLMLIFNFHFSSYIM